MNGLCYHSVQRYWFYDSHLDLKWSIYKTIYLEAPWVKKNLFSPSGGESKHFEILDLLIYLKITKSITPPAQYT
jgi:hypothetical protein